MNSQAEIEPDLDPNNSAPVVTDRHANPVVRRADHERRAIFEIASAIANVTMEVGIVAKHGFNQFHKYKYAAMQDVLQKLTPLISRNGLVIVQTEKVRTMFDNDSMVAIEYEFTIAHKSGEVWPDRPKQTGLCRCRDSKGGFDDKSFNKCHTAARKYFLLALFQIATGEEDDADNEPNTPQQEQKIAEAPPVPACPKCGGPMWDNRERNKDGRKRPDFVCRAGKWNPATEKMDGCEGKYWPGELRQANLARNLLALLASEKQVPLPEGEMPPWFHGREDELRQADENLARKLSDDLSGQVIDAPESIRPWFSWLLGYSFQRLIFFAQSQEALSDAWNCINATVKDKKLSKAFYDALAAYKDQRKGEMKP